MTPYSAIASNKRRSAFFVALFILLVLGIGWAWDRLEGGGTAVVPIAGVFALGSALTGYFAGDKIALAANGARAVTKEEAPELHRLVENLAITAGLPMPAVYLIPSPAINAFATGRDPAHASIAVTTGALEHLERSELEGVLAHELSHVQNYDIRLMTVVAIFVGTIALLADWFLRSRLWGFRGRDDRRNSQVHALVALLGIVLLILSPLIAQLMQLAISRRREFLADASGVLLTRYPQGLMHALRKIGAARQPIETANSATAHLYFANPLSGRALARLFSTHPPLEERIRALENMGSPGG
jgi:heat shock protein HtpX